MKMLIAGKWVDKKEKIEVRDPYDNSLVDTVPSGTAEDIKTAIAAAEKGYQINRNLPVHERIRILSKAASIIEANLEEYARVIAREGSKTIREARKEASRCVDTVRISAEEARRISGETIPFDSRPGSENRVG